GMIPGALTVGGVFLAGWGYYHALGLSVLSLTASLGIAMYPMYKHKKELARLTVRTFPASEDDQESSEGDEKPSAISQGTPEFGDLRVAATA
ncbi:MAG: hypothetical protein ACPG4T_20450, partial [Nannocystaceae bacterium]